MATNGPPPSSAAPNKQSQRIQRDLKALQDKPLSFVRNLELSMTTVENANLNMVKGIMTGPDNSDYAGGHLPFKIIFPAVYPMKPPSFVFPEGICHPNIYSQSGEACHYELIASWAPTISLTRLLEEMHKLLAEPNYDAPVEEKPEIEKNPEKARKWTQEHARPQ
jgi:ubiquitin-protein ligase